MKTFRWTVPEIPQSRAEKKYSAELALRRRQIPTNDELNECRRGEKIASRGYLVALLLGFVITVVLFFVALFLRSQDILISRDLSIAPFFGGLGGAALGTFLSWRRYSDSRQKMRNYLQEQVGDGNAEEPV